MNVKEAIEMLQTLPQDAIIVNDWVDYPGQVFSETTLIPNVFTGWQIEPSVGTKEQYVGAYVTKPHELGHQTKLDATKLLSFDLNFALLDVRAKQLQTQILPDD